VIHTKSNLFKFFVICFGIFSIFFMPSHGLSNPPCVPSCTRYTACWYCAETNHYCAVFRVQDTDYPRTVNVLPVQFHYSGADTNTSNDVCSSSFGTGQCNAGTTSYSNNQLTANAGACTLTPANQLPATLNCYWNDGACITYCSKWKSYECCAAWSC
jgi:hypothetical protein